MRAKRDGNKGVIRYSEAFKMEVVKELEREDLPFAQVQPKYGIKGCGLKGPNNLAHGLSC